MKCGIVCKPAGTFCEDLHSRVWLAQLLHAFHLIYQSVCKVSNAAYNATMLEHSSSNANDSLQLKKLLIFSSHDVQLFFSCVLLNW